MYPKYRIVEMTDGTYAVQWKTTWLQIIYTTLSKNHPSILHAQKYLKWTLEDDEKIRQYRKNKVKSIVEYSE